MATAVQQAGTNHVVAVRFFGGTERGTVVQMSVTESEFADWVAVQVETDDGETTTFGEWFAAQQARGAQVVWETAAHMNEVARRIEENRFFSEQPVMQAAAAFARQRARFVARQSMRVVR